MCVYLNITAQIMTWTLSARQECLMRRRVGGGATVGRLLGVLLNGTNLPFIFEKVSPVSAKVATGAVQELADLDMPHYLRFTL